MSRERDLHQIVISLEKPVPVSDAAKRIISVYGGDVISCKYAMKVRKKDTLPLLTVFTGQYEIIEDNATGKSVYVIPEGQGALYGIHPNVPYINLQDKSTCSDRYCIFGKHIEKNIKQLLTEQFEEIGAGRVKFSDH